MRSRWFSQKRKTFLFLFGTGLVGIFMLGCATSETLDSVKQRLEQNFQRRFLTLRPVALGMTRDEVYSVLSKQIIVGYELTDDQRGQYKPVTLNNPYRSESLTKGGKTYQVDYILLGIKTPDGKVTEDELAPLVFWNDQLVGMGWSFLKRIKG